MIQAKCIQKFRDKNNHIIGYRLQDLNGQTQDVRPDNLKQAIVNKQINVVNLTLTKDGRLVDTAEQHLQSKQLGPAPQKSCQKQISLPSNFVRITRSIKPIIFANKELADNSYIYKPGRILAKIAEDSDYIFLVPLNANYSDITRNFEETVRDRLDDAYQSDWYHELPRINNINKIGIRKALRLLMINANIYNSLNAVAIIRKESAASAFNYLNSTCDEYVTLLEDIKINHNRITKQMSNYNSIISKYLTRTPNQYTENGEELKIFIPRGEVVKLTSPYSIETSDGLCLDEAVLCKDITDDPDLCGESVDFYTPAIIEKVNKVHFHKIDL